MPDGRERDPSAVCLAEANPLVHGARGPNFSRRRLNSRFSAWLWGIDRGRRDPSQSVPVRRQHPIARRLVVHL